MRQRLYRSSPLALISPILLGAGLASAGCSAKIVMGTGVGGDSATGGAAGAGTGAIAGTGADAGAAATTGGNTQVGSQSTGGTTQASTGTVSSFQLQSNTRVNSIDLLLMIDNSQSMADKQATLAAAIPQLLGQIAQPNCVDDNGKYLGPSTLGAAVPCSTGVPEFPPVKDIHIGVITSSLGDHGANTICTPGALTNYTDANGNQIAQPPDVNDMARLVGTLDRASAAKNDPATTYAKLNPLGFLTWGDATLPTMGATDLTAGTKILTDLVTATKENGCGYEAQLESWFRFLIDPVPPKLPLAAPVNNMTTRSGSDDTLLNQRAAFLRPDSLLSIVMLTDENDCSLRDTDVGWVSAKGNSITTGSSQCATNPNDKCCYSCTANPPAGCANGCSSSPPAATDDGPYQANIRCWNQKRRFGYEFLYPTSRYVVGLTNPELCPDQTFGDMDCNCDYAHKIGAACDPGSRRMPNPLYSNISGTKNDGSQIIGYPNAIPRSDNSLVLLTGIVGVPWQDIAAVDANGTLNYIPVTDPAWSGNPTDASDTPVNANTNYAAGIWDMIYGKDADNIVPQDPHMVESIVPRAGLPGPTAAANTDSFNGHEYNTAREDLQYACTYKLPTPRACACDPASTTYASCKYQHPNDCCDTSYKADGAGGPGGDFNKPVCNGTTQVAAKAYPGLREIEVLHDYAVSGPASVKGNSVVASICPKDLSSDPSTPGYGYNPIMSALVDRLKTQLMTSCMPRVLSVNTDGSVPCRHVEAVPSNALGSSNCSAFCAAQGRTAPSGDFTTEVQGALKATRVCDVLGGQSCASMCLCELNQETGSQLATCQNEPNGATVSALPSGFCYVAPEQGFGSNTLVGTCPVTQRRILRYVGNEPNGKATTAIEGSYVVLMCGNAS